MSILRRKLHEFPERLIITGLVLFAANLGAVYQSAAHPAWFAASVLLVSFVTIGVYRTYRVHRLRISQLLKYPDLAFYYARNSWQTRRRIKVIRREVENREKRILADVVEHLTGLDTMLWIQFPHLKTALNDATHSISVALLEDDSRQLGSVVVMNVLSRLGFKVSTVQQTRDLVSSSRPLGVFHFSQRPADIVLVGRKVYPELLNQYLAEVYPWLTRRVVFANDAALAENVARVFGEVMPSISPDPPLAFWNLVFGQIAVAMSFWAAHSDQRHHIFVTPDLPHERDRWPH